MLEGSAHHPEVTGLSPQSIGERVAERMGGDGALDFSSASSPIDPGLSKNPNPIDPPGVADGRQI
jgi:hypothetical protein